jgi:hypothetical protein
MSSPNQDDEADKPLPPPSPSPSPWAEELKRREEARRLQDEVIAAAQRLERQSLELRVEERAAFELPAPRPKFEIARLRPRESGTSLQELPRGIWTPALDPVPMPLPPQDKIGLASPGMLVGMVGAVGVAAAVALLVAHTLQMEIKPASPIVSMSSESGGGKNRSFAAVADNMPRIAAAEPKVQPAQLAAAATAAVVATAPTTDVALAKPSVMPPPPAPTVEATIAKVEPTPPPPEPTKAEPAKPEPTKPASIIPEPRPADSMGREEIAALLKRGQDMIGAGDIASARLFLTRAALAGSADASLALAGTFDAAVLANLRAFGVQPDPAKAQAWYERAADQGSIEAKRRLQQSALR